MGILGGRGILGGVKNPTYFIREKFFRPFGPAMVNLGGGNLGGPMVPLDRLPSSSPGGAGETRLATLMNSR